MALLNCMNMLWHWWSHFSAKLEGSKTNQKCHNGLDKIANYMLYAHVK